MTNRRAGGGGRVTAKKPRYHVDCPNCGGHVPAERCPDCGALEIKKHDCPYCGYVLCADCRRRDEVVHKAIETRLKEIEMSSIQTHKHANLDEAGRCPSCRAEAVAMCADAPNAWLVFYPDSDEIAVVRSYGPTGDGAVETAWATGCNTGETVGCQGIDVATLEASGVECFTLISGDDVDRSLAALGISERPWANLGEYVCGSCDRLHKIGEDPHH
jgi:hypothetical protein